jgi:hypothetical protein
MSAGVCFSWYYASACLTNSRSDIESREVWLWHWYAQQLDENWVEFRRKREFMPVLLNRLCQISHFVGLESHKNRYLSFSIYLCCNSTQSLFPFKHASTKIYMHRSILVGALVCNIRLLWLYRLFVCIKTQKKTNYSIPYVMQKQTYGKVETAKEFAREQHDNTSK